MGNLGFTEIMVILLVVLLLFGAKRLPEIGSSLGKGIRYFKDGLTDAPKKEIDAAAPTEQEAGSKSKAS